MVRRMQPPELIRQPATPPHGGTDGADGNAGLLSVGRPITLENHRFADGRPSLRKRASRALSLFVVAFCTGVAATLASWSYGDAARQMVANRYPQLGWLAPRAQPAAQSASNMIALGAPATPFFEQQQLSFNLDAVRQSIDRIAVGQEQMTRHVDQIAGSIAASQVQMTRHIDQIASNIAAGQEQMTRSTDQTATSIAAGQEPTMQSTNQTATSIAAGQEPTMRSTNQTAATIATGQEQITRNTDQPATDIDQAPSKPTSIPVESRTDGGSLQPTAPLNIKPTEAKQSQTSSQRGKELSAASRQDASCFPSASAVIQNHPGGRPTWTLRAPGHEGTMCWYAAARPRGSDDRPRVSDPRSEKTPEKEIVGTTENGLPAPPLPHSRPPE